MPRRFFRLAVALGFGLGPASGCDVLACFGQDDCGSAADAAFAARPTLDAPAEVAAGAPFEAVVTVTPRVSGTGTVRIVAQVGRLRALAPVADTVDLTDPTGPMDAGSRPVRVAWTVGQPVRVAWTLAVDQIAPFLSGGLGAVVAVDSVRAADGSLVPAEEIPGPSPGGFVAASRAEVRPVRVLGAP